MRHNTRTILMIRNNSDGIRKNMKEVLTDRVRSTLHRSNSQEICRTDR